MRVSGCITVNLSIRSIPYENWENQKSLHYFVTNPQIDELFELALKNGALGGKACGAGGCLVFYCEYDKEHLVRKTLEETGVKIIDFNFDFTRFTNMVGKLKIDLGEIKRCPVDTKIGSGRRKRT